MDDFATLKFTLSGGLFTDAKKLAEGMAHYIGVKIEVVPMGGWLSKHYSVRAQGEYRKILQLKEWAENL